MLEKLEMINLHNATNSEFRSLPQMFYMEWHLIEQLKSAPLFHQSKLPTDPNISERLKAMKYSSRFVKVLTPSTFPVVSLTITCETYTRTMDGIRPDT
jgi:hypothetical protein